MIQLFDHAADDGADLLGLVGGCGFAGADGPDRLIGDDDVLELLLADAAQRDLGLHADDLLGDALFSLFEHLTDAEDDLESGVQRGAGAGVDGLVGLTEVLSALGMADNDILDAHLGEHLGGDFAGEGAGDCPVAVLRADVEVGALAQRKGGFEVGERNAEHNLAAGVLDHRGKLGDERLGGLAVVIHLPVSGNDCFTQRFIHGKKLPF